MIVHPQIGREGKIKAFEMFEDPAFLQAGDIFVWRDYKEGRSTSGHTGLYLGRLNDGTNIIGDAARVTKVLDGVGVRKLREFKDVPDRKFFFLRKFAV